MEEEAVTLKLMRKLEVLRKEKAKRMAEVSHVLFQFANLEVEVQTLWCVCTPPHLTGGARRR